MASLRKALGAVKDQTSIGLAKVGSTNAPELDVAIVKATSHDDMAVDEKYVLQILRLTSISRSYANACLTALAKRLGKTHNWIVAVKVLVLIHRQLRDGNTMFKDEICTVSRRMLNLSNFRDDTHSNAWDYSTFVRTYSSYLDARLDCFIFGGNGRKKRSRDDEYSSAYNDNDGSSSYSEFRSRYGDDGYEDDRHRDSEPKQSTKETPDISIKEMQPQLVLEKLPGLQQILERVLACRPTGSAKTHRLIHIALYTLISESFQIYQALGDAFFVLLQAYPEMKQEDCVKVLDSYIRFGKQSDSLASLFDVTKSIGVCRDSDYPTIEKISEDQIDSLERNLKDRSPSPAPHSPRRTEKANLKRDSRQTSESKEQEVDHENYESIYGMRALPAPPTAQPPTIPQPSVSETSKGPAASASSDLNATPSRSLAQDTQGDLVNLKDSSYSPEEEQNKFALALFSATPSNNSWETFDGDDQAASKKTTTSTASYETAGSESEKAGWELALVAEASNFTKVESSLAGKFDNLLLNSMYDHAVAARENKVSIPTGSSSSVALPGKPPSSVLALPAPVPTAGEDPFAASIYVPPPAYVQMADLRQKQTLLLQEQQMWQQYQQNGMLGLQGQMSFITPYAGTPYPVQPPLGSPYVGMGTSAQGR